MMLRTLGPLICFLILIMDIVAGILSIQAEVAQDKEKHIRVWIFECRQPSHKAHRLGLAAATLLALAHFIGNLLGGCICIRSKEELDKSSPNKQLAAATLIITWIIYVIAFSTIVIGAISNSRSRDTCGLSHRHLLSIGGILCFIHGLFLVAYYVSASATIAEAQLTYLERTATAIEAQTTNLEMPPLPPA
ncbi:hypothetical protein Droror1_Dr00010506 [Drosera rotundifolia]